MKYSSWRGDAAQGDVASDEELVLEFRDRGRDAAYGELIRRYQIPIFRLFLGFLGGGDEAEEECETTFFKGAKEIGDLREPAKFYPWLVERAQQHAVGVVSQSQTSLAADSEVGPRAPEVELKDAVQRALTGMAPIERAVLIFAELQQAAPEEIAEALGRPVDEVRTLVKKAKRHFLDRLSQAQSRDVGQEAPPLKPGTVIDGRFRIKGMLGRGGMGAVYLAEHEGLGREVAVKVMTEIGGEHEKELRERFRREALVLGRLKHPNFVEVMDFGETAHGQLFLALELLEGHSLADVLDPGALEPRDALTVMRHLLTALAELHDQGIVHRDVKPDNMVVLEGRDDPWFTKLLDLGIAALVTSSAVPQPDVKLTQANVVLGTPAYIAPEQAAAKAVDGRADLYSAAVVLFEMLTGNLPFTAKNAVMLMAKHLTIDPPRLEKVAPDLPARESLQELLDKGLAKVPAKRFGDARAFLAAVEAVLSELG